MSFQLQSHSKRILVAASIVGCLLFGSLANPQRASADWLTDYIAQHQANTGTVLRKDQLQEILQYIGENAYLHCFDRAGVDPCEEDEKGVPK